MRDNRKLHYLALAAALCLGAILRLGNLDGKFLWLDEVITAIFSFGRNYNNVPLNIVIPFHQLQQIFVFQPEVSCTQIAENLAIQSTHPPLFFCLLHNWFSLVNPVSPSWVWTLRAFGVFWGVVEIAALYLLNTKAFSPSAGLMAAVMMAVSPFGVYLSQEARHYTLPVFLITSALLGLILIQKDLLSKRVRVWVWAFWTTINIIGLYVHYFFILALVAEIVTLLAVMYRYRRNLPRYSKLALTLAILAIIVSYIPWLPILIGHFSRPETSWIPSPHNVAPLYQIFAAWLLAIAAFPVENQPIAIATLSGLGILVFGSWVLWLSFKGIKQLWKSTNLSVFTLASFTIIVLLEFLAIVYFLGKDITITPRYNFVYYPVFLALVAAGLNKSLKRSKQTFSLIFLGSLLSCVFVISNLAFQKPYNPQQVAQNINLEPSVPMLVVMGYRDYQNVALGLSFALGLEKVRDSGDFVFLERSPNGYNSVWQKLALLPPLKSPLLNLWVIAPDLRQREYPPQLALSEHSCLIDTKQHYRIGVPYQLYRCKN
ncbi:glycosyltransferase family 39 protein [Synechocystis sp. PCC 7509]|uniref:glycosyltransferase family 39 protein n=1 Tax=Synechocystis sp. PCC 7509 TaxID=927677 RepID=UPI0002AC0986|nr:glycosyltransferase family 39 protein [Synechocystis sp. PCC 7509]